MAVYECTRLYIVVQGGTWLSKAVYGRTRLYRAVQGCTWLYKAEHGRKRLSMARLCMAVNGPTWPKWLTRLYMVGKGCT